MKKYKKLMSNSIIFFMGNFGSRLINFFMVPLYTSILVTSEYGIMDLMITTIGLLIPIITLELGQAILRFSIEDNSQENLKKIHDTFIIYLLFLIILIPALYPIASYYQFFNEYTFYFVLMLLVSLINTLYSSFVRGIGRVKEFAFNGILTTIISVSCNLLFLVKFKWGIDGYLLAYIIANTISSVYLIFIANSKVSIKKPVFDAELFKSMTFFSIPLIPNSAIWWLINGSTRYIIIYFMGASANGLFAVANKIPTILSIITSIFSQAWQLSSFEEYESRNEDKFFSTVFSIYSSILFLSSSFILVILHDFMSFFVNNTYYDSWTVVPFLLLGVVYQSFSSFLGTNYTAAKKTKGVFTTTLIGGIISVLTCIILVPIFGIIGAGIAVYMSFFSIFIIRILDTRKFIILDINKVIFISANIILLAQIFVLFVFEGILLYIFNILLFLALFFISFIEYKELLLSGIKRIMKR